MGQACFEGGYTGLETNYRFDYKSAELSLIAVVAGWEILVILDHVFAFGNQPAATAMRSIDMSAAKPWGLPVAWLYRAPM